MPKGLKPVCIVAIVFAGFGLLGALSGVYAAVADTPMGMDFFPSPGGAQAEAHQAYQAAVVELMREWSSWFLVVAALNLVAAPLMAVGGIFGLQRNGLAPMLLTAGFALAVGVELIGVVPSFGYQLDMIGVMREHFSAMTGTHPAMPGFGKTMAGVMEGSMIGGMVIGGAFMAGKIVFYVWGTVQLRKPAVKTYFASGGDA